MKKWLAAFLLLLLFLVPWACLGEAELSASRTDYALGEAVRLTLTGDREIKSCKYTVTLDGQEIFRQKTADKHMDVCYLPRLPGTYRIDAAFSG